MTQNISDMSLRDSIAAFRAGIAKQAPPEVVATLGAELARLAESGIAKKALRVGEKAPELALPDARDRTVTLSSVLAKGPAVVTFYRYGGCPFCNLQLRAYQSVLARIHNLGAELIAISGQTADYALSDVEQKQLMFPVLHDANHRVSREYGLVFSLSETMKKLQIGFGSPIPKFMGNDSWEINMPGTFVLDRSGVVKLAHVDPNYTVRLEPAAIVNALESIAAVGA